MEIANVMKRKGMSASALGRKLGVSRNRISAIMSGKSKPDYFTMKAMRKALDIDPADAVGIFFPNWDDKTNVL